MASITTRVGKGSPLTTQELDANFTNLNTDKLEKSGESASFADLTLQSVSSTLHRSPNAITALFVYDTSKASDGGAFTEKLGHTSWARESLNGRWLGAQASEASARAVSGATTGDYFQLTTDGKIYKLNATSGTTQVYRGNKSALPKLMALVSESLGLFVYDLTESGRPLWRHFPVGANEIIFAAPTCISAIQSIIAVGSASGMAVIDIAKDRATKITTAADQVYKGPLAVATAGWGNA